MSLHSYVDSYANIPLNINNYSGVNYQLALSIARSSSNSSPSSPSTSNFGTSPSDKSDSIQATSSGSYMTHCYFGNHSANYVTITRG